MDTIDEKLAALGRSLKTARAEAGITQEELADLANVSSRPIYRFEQGKASIRLDTFLKLLAALGLEIHIGPKAR